MRTKIISAFPGTGKSYFHNKNKETTLDSDSSNFSWIIDENFIKLISNNWENWIKEISFKEYGVEKIEMILPNLEDELNHLIAIEYGETLD